MTIERAASRRRWLVIIAVLAAAAGGLGLASVLRQDGPQPTHRSHERPASGDAEPPGSGSLRASPRFGIAPGAHLLSVTDDELAREFDAYEQLGAGWVRLDAYWALTERVQGSFDWSRIDRMVTAAQKRELRVLLTIAYTPAWARPPTAGDKFAPPPEAYGAFAEAVVRRYAYRGVRHYEIWNEPNLGCCFFQPRADAAHYAEMLKAAYPRMKAVDPTITVLAGSMGPASDDGVNLSPPTFLRSLYENGAAGHFDALAHHPYYGPQALDAAHDWSAWTQMTTDTSYGASLRRLMETAGDGGKQLWATEANMRVDPNRCVDGQCATEERQAELLTDAFEAWLRYPWAGVFFVYNYRGHDGWSLTRSDGSKRPAWHAYRSHRKRDGDVGTR